MLGFSTKGKIVLLSEYFFIVVMSKINYNFLVEEKLDFQILLCKEKFIGNLSLHGIKYNLGLPV